MKKLTILLALLGLILMLAACGGGPAGGPTGGPQTGEAVDDATGEVQLAEELSVYNWDGIYRRTDPPRLRG